jgi:NADH-quinone oxidoreductase subunit N
LDKAFNFPIPDNVWPAVLPVILVALAGVFCLIITLFGKSKENSLSVVVSIVGLALAGVVLLAIDDSVPLETMGDMFVLDRFGTSLQFVLIISAIISILFSESYLREKQINFGEFYPLLLWSTVGAMLMAATNNMLMMFVGLEILSISLYVLAGLSRKEEKSEEAAMKYFLLGAFASGFFLFGIAFIYGATNSLNVVEIVSAWQFGGAAQHALVVFGLALMLVGLGFKASFVPFHQWTPDVYQGAPTNVASFMATGSKVAAIAALTRLLTAAYPLREIWLPALFIVAALTMLVGNLVALTQKDVKRILAYSSISHAGYILVAILSSVVAPSSVSPASLSYYLLSYSFMTAGAFAIISLAAKGTEERTSLNDLRGMWQRSPIAAATMVLCMLSLMGMPPTAGFIGKALIFSDAVRAGLTPLAIVLAISSVISVYYYLAIARAAMSSDEEYAGERLAKPSPGLLGACAISIVGIIGGAIFFTPLISILR